MVKLVAVAWIASLGFIGYRLSLTRRAARLERAGEEKQAVALRERAQQLRIAVAVVLLTTFAVLLTLVLV